MKDKILGIVAICLLLIAGVYAFGPHTRFNYPTVQEDCVYYYGPGQSCRVDDKYCNPNGADIHLMLDTATKCISSMTSVEKTQVVQAEQTAVAQKEAQEERGIIGQATGNEAGSDGVAGIGSYLWLVIPLLILFALLVILWLLYYEKYKHAKRELSHVRSARNKTNKELKTLKGKRVRTLCPRDGTPMKRTGTLKQGPKGGMRQTYVCPKCSHRTMRTYKQ